MTSSTSGVRQPRVAVIGSGYWGRNLVRNFHDLGALAAVCDSDRAVAEELSKKYPSVRFVATTEEVLASDVDGVVIATPAETHADLVRLTLEAGKDVFVEKPLCLSVAVGEKLVALAEQKERVLMVGHLLWYHPAILKLKELIIWRKLPRCSDLCSAMRRAAGPQITCVCGSWHAKDKY